MLESESTLPLRISRPCLRKTQTATFWGLFLAPHCATLRLKALEIVTTRDTSARDITCTQYLRLSRPHFDIHATTHPAPPQNSYFEPHPHDDQTKTIANSLIPSFSFSCKCLAIGICRPAYKSWLLVQYLLSFQASSSGQKESKSRHQTKIKPFSLSPVFLIHAIFAIGRFHPPT
jgi:hypothetical protein